MQMSADECPSRVGERLQRAYRDVLGSDGVVDDVVGYDTVLVEDFLGPLDVAHVFHPRRASIVGLAPIELLLGMDDHREDGSRIWREMNDVALHVAVIARTGQRSSAASSEYRLLMSAAVRVSLLKTLLRWPDNSMHSIGSRGNNLDSTRVYNKSWCT